MYTFLSIYTLREKSAQKFLRKLYSRFSAKKKKKEKKERKIVFHRINLKAFQY